MDISTVPDRVNPVSFPDGGRLPTEPAPRFSLSGRLRRGWRLGMALCLTLLTAGSASAGLRELALGSALIGQARPQADLVVTMLALDDNVPVGGQIHYRIQVTNQGPDLATGVIVTDLLPVGLDYVSANTTQGSSSISQRTLIVNVGSIVVGQTVAIDLIVMANRAGVFQNGVSLRTETPDPNLDNNTASYPASAGPQPPPPPPQTPETEPGPPCAIDQSRAVLVQRGMLRYNPPTRRFIQQVMLGNTSRVPITGPVWLVLDELGPVVLTNATGVTRCRAPLGSPYIQINVGADNVLSPQEVVSMTLSFAIPANQGLRYRTRVLTGTATR